MPNPGVDLFGGSKALRKRKPSHTSTHGIGSTKKYARHEFWVWGFMSVFVVREARRGGFVMRGFVVENRPQPWPWPLTCHD